MSYYSTLGSYVFTEQGADDIRGARIYGVNDEKLGKIDDVVFASDTGKIYYAIVDTGGWLSTKRFIVPADRLYASAAHEDDFEVNLTKSQIEKFPPYDEKAMESQEKWGAYETRYRAAWPATPGTQRGQIGSRWSSFEDRVRRDRERIVVHVTPERQRKVS